MKLNDLKNILETHSAKQPRFILPGGKVIPLHFHLTEVGYVSKNFIDCGGTIRTSSSCVLQVWLGSDKDHRLSAGKLLSILELGKRILPSQNLDVEVEYEDGVISQFPLIKAEASQNSLNLHLDLKHTDCLAKEVCGIESVSDCVKSVCC